jgi:WXG100 family type VII secretion target
MTSGFQTIPEVMLGTAADCDRTAAEYDAQFAALRTYCESLNGPWLGPSSTAFQDLMRQYDVETKNLNVALRGIADGLRNNAANYVEGETLNNSQITAIREAMPGPGGGNGAPPANL